MQLPTRDRDDHPASGQTLTAGALTRGTTDLRGYRATTVAWTGVLALLGGAAQAAWVSNPADSPGSYLLVWVGVAVAGILTLMLELTSRWNRLPGPGQRAGLLRTLFTLTPAFAAGGLVTLALISRGDGSPALLPGLWMILFALAIYASLPRLPRGVGAVGAFYLLAGAAVLCAPAQTSLAPWTMAGVFGIGQLWAAHVLSGHPE